MSENERNYSAYLQNVVNSATPMVKFSTFFSNTLSMSM